jgi:DNA-directed RNA polymerase subunit RPC12/RpoP
MPIATTTTSLVCPNCKKETGLTKEFILDMTPLKDVYCPYCKKLVLSCKPMVQKFDWSTYNSGTDYSGADYD